MPSVGFDTAAHWAKLAERVDNQGRDIGDLRSNMNTGFRNMESALNALSSELRNNGKTQWPVIWSAIGVSFAVIIAAGSQALSPLRDAVSELKAGEENLITRREMDEIRKNLVTRDEWADFKTRIQQ